MQVLFFRTYVPGSPLLNSRSKHKRYIRKSAIEQNIFFILFLFSALTFSELCNGATVELAHLSVHDETAGMFTQQTNLAMNRFFYFR